jgi:hypothetical protein
MTANEYFKKGFYIEFYTEPYIVLLFKEKGLYKETYEAIKEEFKSKELYLTIARTGISKVSLVVTEGDNYALESTELDYDYFSKPPSNVICKSVLVNCCCCSINCCNCCILWN